VREDAGERGRKTKTVRQHILCAGFSEVLPKIFVAVKDLAKDALGAGKIDIALFH